MVADGRIEQLLSQWSQWRMGPVVAGMGRALLMQYAPREGGDQVATPYWDTAFERLMLDVDRAVAGLEPVLRAVVETEYGHGAALIVADRAARCRCGEDAYRRRLGVAHQEILAAIGRSLK
jgi:hypothetical protein